LQDFYLGMMSEYGLGTDESFVEAARLYRKASEKRDAEATYYLALMHAYGRGQPQNFVTAAQLCEQVVSASQAGQQRKECCHGTPPLP
jgi:TPR repeat protein